MCRVMCLQRPKQAMTSFPIKKHKLSRDIHFLPHTFAIFVTSSLPLNVFFSWSHDMMMHPSYDGHVAILETCLKSPYTFKTWQQWFVLYYPKDGMKRASSPSISTDVCGSSEQRDFWQETNNGSLRTSLVTVYASFSCCLMYMIFSHVFDIL